MDDILGDITDYINGVYKNTMSTKDANHSKLSTLLPILNLATLLKMMEF